MQLAVALTTMQISSIGHCDEKGNWLARMVGSRSTSGMEVAKKVATLKDDGTENYSLDFSADGNYLAVGAANKLTVTIWDWKTGKLLRTLERAQGAGLMESTESLLYSPNGRFLAVCHGRAAEAIVIRVWETESWTVVKDITDPVGGGGCNAIAFSPDGKFLFRVMNRFFTKPGDTVLVYDVSNWQYAWGLRTVPFGPVALALSPDGQLLALGGRVTGDSAPKTQIAILNIAQRTIVRTIPETVDFTFGRLGWSPDGRQIASIGPRGWNAFGNNGTGEYISGADTVMVFDALSGRKVSSEQVEVGHASLKYTPEGRYLVEGEMNGRGTGWGVRIWDGKHTQLLQEIPGNVIGLGVSRDGRYLAVGERGKVDIWQLK
jgi:WD40 repeat protein